MIRLLPYVYDRDADGVYHAEDYEGMDCACAGCWNATGFDIGVT